MRTRDFSPILALVVASAAAPSSAGAAPPASAAVTIERIVAVVGHAPIVLSELRARARPFAAQIAQRLPDDAARRAQAERALERELLDRMIDELLFAAEATRLHVAVTASEIDVALGEVASKQAVTVPDLMAEARRQGMSEPEYRDELRRQILDFKLMQQVVRQRIKGFAALAEADRDARLAEERHTWIGELRAKCFIEVRL
jgi:peptidyl-prolyl cis-trans isomerase SurA